MRGSTVYQGRRREGRREGGRGEGRGREEELTCRSPGSRSHSPPAAHELWSHSSLAASPQTPPPSASGHAPGRVSSAVARTQRH